MQKKDIIEMQKKAFKMQKELVEQAQKAEKVYKENQEASENKNWPGKEEHAYELGKAYYKLASFHRTGLKCNILNSKKVELKEEQKKIFTMAENLYKNAAMVIIDYARKGVFKHVSLQSTVMNELSVMYAAVGEYQKAVDIGKAGIQIDKAIYETKDDRLECGKLANRMNTLAAIYTFMKNPQLASETLEDANYVLEEHESEDPVTFGIMLARNHINLGNCYKLLEEEKENADSTLDIGIEKVLEANEKSNDKFLNDVIMSCVVVGDHYKRKGKTEKAKKHYAIALEKANVFYAKTKDAKLENLIKRLKTLV